MSVNISLSGLIRRKNRRCVRVWQRAKAEPAMESRVSASRRQQRRGRGVLRRREGGPWRQKEKRLQMLWKFLDKATYVFHVEGIAGMTVKPQRSLALCQRLAWRKYQSTSCQSVSHMCTGVTQGKRSLYLFIQMDLFSPSF